VIGVDHGTRRVGLAVGDEETGMAFPRSVVPANQAAERIVALAREEGASRVVVGLPLNADGSEGPQARTARAFGDRLAGLGLEVVLSDERWTTWAAAQPGPADRRPAANTIDSAAAALILEQYFADRRRPSEET
jgi:putative Holliday junction resolvase